MPYPLSAITVPLLFGEHVFGVISASSYQPDAFDDDDLLALEVISGQVAIAIANLRHSGQLDSQLQRRVWLIQTGKIFRYIFIFGAAIAIAFRTSLRRTLRSAPW